MALLGMELVDFAAVDFPAEEHEQDEANRARKMGVQKETRRRMARKQARLGPIARKG